MASKRKRLLDLYCKAGGASVGYAQAGFEIVGVDIEPQPRHPIGEFIQDDVFNLDPEWIKEFDAVHASPPCQHYSNLAARNGNRDDHPPLIGPTRELLQSTGLPFVIENVVGAPLLEPVTLCGSQFQGLRVYRHRLFETNWPLPQPDHSPHTQLCYTTDKRKSHYGKLNEWTSFVMVNGGGNCTKAAALDAMGIDWPMTKDEANNAIPPAYAEYIGRHLMGVIG